MSEYIVLLLMGLAGSLHCAGMCGPICLALTKKEKPDSALNLNILVYHFSRISAYIFLGIILFFFSDVSGLNTYQNSISIFSGVAILVFVFFTAFWYKLEYVAAKFPLYKYVKQSLSKSLNSTSGFSFVFTGFLNGLLPCGLVYIALINALRQQEIQTAVFSMFFFGIGTLPMMTMIGLGSQFLKRSNIWSRSRIGITTVLAVFFILRGLNLGIPYISPSVNHDHSSVSPHDPMCH